MKATLRIEGGEQLAATLRELSTRAAKHVLRDSLREAGAEPMRQRISALAPRDAGAPDLADHITVSTSRADTGPSAALLVGPSTAVRTDRTERRYDIQGNYLEYGTVHMAMRAFVRPAFDGLAARLVAPIGAAIWRRLIARGFGSGRGSGGGVGL